MRRIFRLLLVMTATILLSGSAACTYAAVCCQDVVLDTGCSNDEPCCQPVKNQQSEAGCCLIKAPFFSFAVYQVFKSATPEPCFQAVVAFIPHLVFSAESAEPEVDFLRPPPGFIPPGDRIVRLRSLLI